MKRSTGEFPSDTLTLKTMYKCQKKDESIKESTTYKAAMKRCYETPQNTPHHIYDVGHHIEAVVSHIPKEYADDITITAAMLHDIGKPDVRTTKPDGTDRFLGHAKRSAEIAEEILDEAGICKDKETILWIIKHHEIGDVMRPKTIRRMLNEMGLSNILRLFVVRYADIMGQSDYERSEKLNTVIANLDVLSAVLKEEDKSDMTVLVLKTYIRKREEEKKRYERLTQRNDFLQKGHQ